MDNELFELCKEVYRRFPAWKYEIDWMIKVNIGLPSEYIRRAFYEEDNDEDDFLYGLEEYGSDHAVPLYTSDYILEKLPKDVIPEGFDESDAYCLQLAPGMEDIWQADYRDWRDGQFTAVVANTPLKALLKLTIALHEAGELENG